MRLLSMVARTTCVLVLALGLGSASTPRAQAEPGVEYLMVPSAAMGRDIPVAFLAGGPHAVYLLDAFNAAPDVSNWVTAGNAMNTLAGKGISVAAPAGGAWSMYTDWEQDGSRQWETFLSGELPNWLAANKGLTPGRARRSSARPRADTARWRWRPSIRTASATPARCRVSWRRRLPRYNGAITAGLMQFGGVDSATCGVCHSSAVGSGTIPTCTCSCWPQNNTRLWVFSPATMTSSDPAAMIGAADQAQGSNRSFYHHYREIGGRNGHFDFPAGRRPRLGHLGAAAGRDVGRHRGGDRLTAPPRAVQQGAVASVRGGPDEPVPWRRATDSPPGGQLLHRSGGSWRSRSAACRRPTG